MDPNREALLAESSKTVCPYIGVFFQNEARTKEDAAKNSRFCSLLTAIDGKCFFTTKADEALGVVRVWFGNLQRLEIAGKSAQGTDGPLRALVVGVFRFANKPTKW